MKENNTMYKLIITAPLAHFKVPYSSKIQKTYKIPPISTVIGILKSIYSDNIDNFSFGFTFDCKDNNFTDIQTIYKETKDNKGVNKSDICYIDYLINARLVIFTDINSEITLNETLNLGKTDCLAKLRIEKVRLENKEGEGFNQWTPINIGTGKIFKIATETKYNPIKGIYDITLGNFRFNPKFDYSKNYDSSEGNIFMWEYKGGKIFEKID